MATKSKWLEYTIHLTDRAAVTARQAEFPFGTRVSPDEAAATYAAPIQGSSGAFAAPCIRSPWFWTAANYPRNVSTFTRKSGGWFGLSFLFGTTTQFAWIGKFVFGEGDVATINGVPTEIVALAQRRWIDGFEIPEQGEGSTGGTARRCFTRDASRHPDGMGFAFRGDSGNTTHQVTEFKPGNTTRSHWDRFYIRLRKVPTADARFWVCTGGIGSEAIELVMTPSRQIGVANISGGTPTTIFTPSNVLTANTWYRIDIVLSFATGGSGAGAFIKLYLNGALIGSKSDFTAAGLGTQGAYLTSQLGSVSNNTLEADFDDWMGAEEPLKESVSPFRYVGKDWLNGSKMLRVQATSFGTGHDAVNWSNQSYSNLNQLPESAVTGMVSTTASAPIVVNTDAGLKVDAQPNTLGIAAMVVGVYHNAITSGASSLGFKIAGGVLDLVVLPAVSGLDHQHHMYRPAAITSPTKPLTPLTLHYLKDADATSDTVYHLNAVAEIIGTFGSEDIGPGLSTPVTIPKRSLGAHNNPYPESPYARLIAAPAAPYVIHSGQYVGNGTGQDLLFRLPVHWFYTRRVGTVTHTPGLWFAPMIASHQSLNEQVQPDCPVQAFIDPAFTTAAAEDDQEQRTIVRITGADPQVNENTIAYQYVAVCDPLGRFLLTGGFGHGGVNATHDDALPNVGFTPEAGFIQWETPDGGTTFRNYYKGPGHAANAASRMDQAETADFLAWSSGIIQPRDAATIATQLFAAFATWRRDDGSAETALAKAKCVQMGSYVGDGSASRAVSFGPTGVRPLWAVVVPHNNPAILRDPSHTGTTSCLWTGVNNTTTGITAGGIDSFVVGTALNANGIVYDWFVLPGSATAGNNGWSIDGEFVPVEPESPFNGPFPIGDETAPPPTGPGEDDEPPDDSEDCDAGEVCVEATTKEVNRALLEIGNTKFLTNYCTQSTVEAQTARILYESSVRATLHDFPWPFATRYAALVLVANQPTDQDWDYAYRKPIDCVFERRLVVTRGPGVDPKGPPFELSSDTLGGLILTNEVGAVLEYTARPTCVAFVGDPLFLEALKWHLAAAMAPPLTRMADKAKFCREQYDLAIAKANAIIKPGQPGLRTVPDPAGADAAAACITANIAIVNLALLRIGANTIANLATEQSREAVAANLIFEHELRATLRDFPWKFAKRYNDALVTVGGTATVPVNADWQYSYRLPTDYVAVRRLVVTGTGRSFETDPITFEVGTDATGYLLFTGELDPNLEYTARIACAVARADDLFRDAFAWRLAASLAPSLAQVDPEREEQRGRGPDYPPNPEQRISHKPSKAAMRERAARFALGMYLRTLELARVADANEADPEPHGEAPWISGRD